MYLGHLVPGPLPDLYPFLWLRQAFKLKTHHRLFRSDDPSFGSSHYALRQPLCCVVMGPDPELFESRTQALGVALRLCRVTTQGAGRRGHYSPRGVAQERTNDGLKHLLPCRGNAHLPSHLAQGIIPALIRLEHLSCC
jgi:hypothetical protein